MTGRRRTPLMPTPPQWALDAGLPEPEDGETYCDYVTRLGYSCSELMAGLEPRTEVLAHIRLVNKLADSLPDAWNEHLRLFVKAHKRTPPPTKHPRPTL